MQRSSVRRNVYRSTDPPSIRYKELELPLELRQFFELFLLGPEPLSIPRTITDKAKLMELLMPCHVFPQYKEDIRAENTRIIHRPTLGHLSFRALLHRDLSAKRTSSFHFFNSGDALQKKTSKPRIRAEMLDGWEDVEGILHRQGLSYVPEIIWTELTSRHHDEGTLALRKLEDSLSGKSTRPAVATY